MNFEEARNQENVVDFAKARQRKEEERMRKDKISSPEQEESFTDTLRRYITQFEADNEKLNNSLESKEIEGSEEKTFFRRKMSMNREEIQRILFVMSRYSPKHYEERLDAFLKEFESADVNVRTKARLRLVEMEHQVEEFKGIFEDYNLREEVGRVESLQGRIADALLAN